MQAMNQTSPRVERETLAEELRRIRQYYGREGRIKAARSRMWQSIHRDFPHLDAYDVAQMFADEFDYCERSRYYLFHECREAFRRTPNGLYLFP